MTNLTIKSLDTKRIEVLLDRQAKLFGKQNAIEICQKFIKNNTQQEPFGINYGSEVTNAN